MENTIPKREKNKKTEEQKNIKTEEQQPENQKSSGFYLSFSGFLMRGGDSEFINYP